MLEISISKMWDTWPLKWKEQRKQKCICQSINLLIVNLKFDIFSHYTNNLDCDANWIQHDCHTHAQGGGGDSDNILRFTSSVFIPKICGKSAEFCEHRFCMCVVIVFTLMMIIYQKCYETLIVNTTMSAQYRYQGIWSKISKYLIVSMSPSPMRTTFVVHLSVVELHCETGSHWESKDYFEYYWTWFDFFKQTTDSYFKNNHSNQPETSE